MAIYYLDYKRNELNERIIHEWGCPFMKARMDYYLLLGDFSRHEFLQQYTLWHFPDWNIKFCTCCQSHVSLTQKAG